MVNNERAEPADQRVRGTGRIYAGNHKLPIEWARRVRKEEYVRPIAPHGEENVFGVYFIFKAWSKADLPFSMPKFHQGTKPSYSSTPAEPLHALLFLRAGSRPGADDQACGTALSRYGLLLLDGHWFIEQEMNRNRHRVSQERQRVPGRRRCRGTAGRPRSADR